MLPIVDTHQHLWDLTKFRLPWLKEGDVFNKSHVMSDYLEGHGRAERREVGLHGSGRRPGTADRGGRVRHRPVPAGRQPDGRGRDLRPAGVRRLPQVHPPVQGQRLIKGVRQVLHATSTPPGYCLDEKFIQGVRLLGDLGKSFDLCMRAKELPDAAKLIDACPDTRFILDHCGNADVQAKDRSHGKRAWRTWRSAKTWSCKVSGIVASAEPGKWTADDLAPIVNHTMEGVRPRPRDVRRRLAGLHQGGDLQAVGRGAQEIVAERQEEEQRKLFYDNAVRFYGLPE